MTFLLLVIAAIFYTAGGVFMKISQGLTQFFPTVLLFVTMGLGIIIQALAQRQMQLSVTYLMVLGLEATLALAGSVLIFHEGLSGLKILGFVLVVSGIGFLQLSQS
jgi:small multidrug resistance pump